MISGVFVQTVMGSLTVTRTVELIKTSFIKVIEKGKQNMGNLCKKKKRFAPSESFETTMPQGLPITFSLSGFQQSSKQLILTKIHLPTPSYERYNLENLRKHFESKIPPYKKISWFSPTDFLVPLKLLLQPLQNLSFFSSKRPFISVFCHFYDHIPAVQVSPQWLGIRWDSA